MRNVTRLLAVLLFLSRAIIANAQTLIIDPTGEGGFELGTDFASNGWNVENYAANNANKWFVGTAAGSSAGSNSAYVSDHVTGATHTYNTSAISRVMFWRDVVFPAGETQITLTYKVKIEGELNWDDINVFVQSGASVPPVTQPAASGSALPSIANATLIANWVDGEPTEFIEVTDVIPANLAGNALTSTTRRIIFFWENDSADGVQPPIAIDEISLVSSIPVAPPNDNCSNAISLTPDAGSTCTSPTSGTTVNATQSIPAISCGGFTGSADDDVWYSFTAIGTSHIVTVNTSSIDAVLDVRSGACNGTSIGCSDASIGIGAETVTLTGLTVSQTYYIRIYAYGTGVGQGAFTVCVTSPPGMTYSSTTATQITTATQPGAVDQQVIRAAVVMTNSNNPLSATEIVFGTAGTSSVADLTNAKVYYTGTSTVFSTATPFGSVIANPNGTLTFTGDQVLNAGNNYFWLAYDVACSAPGGNVIDGQYISVTIDAIARTPTIGDPGGSRAITGFTATTLHPTSSALSVGSQNNQILRVAVTGSAACTQVSQLNLSTGTTPTPDVNLAAARVYYTGTTSSFTDGTPSGTQFGTDILAPNGVLEFNGSQTLVNGTNYFFLVYDIACGAPGGAADAACTNVVYNGTPLTPTTPNPTGTRTITPFSVAANHQVTTNVTAGTQYNQMLRLAVVGNANCGPVTQINLTTTGTVTPSNLATARVYYTGSTATFTDGAAGSTQFGTDIVNPDGTMEFNGSQALLNGTNYFFLVYDIACNAAANAVDATCTNVVYNGVTLTPANGSPANARTVVPFSVIANHPVTTAVNAGSQNNQILRLAVTGNEICNQVTQLNLTTTGTASTANLAAARVFYTGANGTFADGAASGTQFGVDIVSPNGTMEFNGYQTLVAGTNYFFLVYDIICAGTATAVDAGCTNIVYNGATLTPATPNPGGSRTITSVVFSTVADGDWSNPATWSCGVPPNGTTIAVNINHNVNIDVDAFVQSTVTVAPSRTLTVATNTFGTGGGGTGTQNLVINGTVNVSGSTLNVGTATTGSMTSASITFGSAGALNITGGTLNVGTALNANVTTGNITIPTGASMSVSGTGTVNLGLAGGYNRNLSVTGTLTTSGTLNVNGNVVFNTGSTFNMSDGNFTIDGNGPASVASGTYLLRFGSGSTGMLLNGTGGTITIVDPHATNGTANYVIGISIASSNVPATSLAGITFQFGDGASTVAGNTSGFIFDTYISTKNVPLGNVIVNSGNGATRFVSGTASTGGASDILGTLTVNPGCEIRTASASGLGVYGNIVNDGTISVLSTTGVLFLGGRQLGGAPAATMPQTISGTGVWRNSLTTPTARIYSLTMNNGGGTTLQVPLTVNGTLTLNTGKIYTDATNYLGIGAGLLPAGTVVAGTVSPATTTSASHIVGTVRKAIPTGTTWAISDQRGLFPIGDGSVARQMNIAVTTAPASAGSLAGTFNLTDPGTPDVPYTDGSISIQTTSPTGFWNVEYANGAAAGLYSVQCNATGFTKRPSGTISVLSGIRLIKRSSNGSWVAGADGTAAAPGSLASVTRTACSSFSDFAIGGTFTALPLELLSFNGNTGVSSNFLQWETLTEENVQWHIVERSEDGIKWVETGRKAGQLSSNVALKYELEDRTPPAKAYYRLRSVDVDGSENLSNSILLTRKGEHFGIAAAFPSPAKDKLTVRFTSITEENVTIRITDITGRMVLEQQISAEKGINESPVQLSGLQAGMYMVSISNATESTAPVRIVKE